MGRGTSETAGAIVELDAEGDCHVYTGYCEMGQGALPMVLGLVAGELGLPAERVHVLLPDTSRAPETSPSTASRQAFMTGNAAVTAARELRAELSHRAADGLDAQPADIRLEGAFLVDGRQRPPDPVGGARRAVRRRTPVPAARRPRRCRRAGRAPGARRSSARG